ncbi:aminotransferase class I/II-fold pyridoxal phosphate-dependent enzyme [Vicingaceae bacterium]|nr:aminotransferase class I/II-fold pyridoxal phosphate-dependent enzyme [Vicingaceae bacterium]
MQDDTTVAVEETEYTPYYDMLKLLDRKHKIIPSNPENSFRPVISDYEVDAVSGHDRVMLLKSNPCNPTGVETTGDKLRTLVEMSMQHGRAAMFDEAYEFYCDPPVSALQYIPDINQTEIVVVGAATKGLQVPGMRIGWAIASESIIEVFRNYSSIGMGGVSRPAQIYVTRLLELERVRQARDAVSNFFQQQRDRYREGLTKLGIELFTGNGGFYHWGRLPGETSAAEFNERLFQHNAGILPGVVCDMHRRNNGPLENFIRFSFGPILPETYEGNLEILAKCL